jgi:hypothetical protein
MRLWLHRRSRGVRVGLAAFKLAEPDKGQRHGTARTRAAGETGRQGARGEEGIGRSSNRGRNTMGIGSGGRGTRLGLAAS